MLHGLKEFVSGIYSTTWLLAANCYFIKAGNELDLIDSGTKLDFFSLCRTVKKLGLPLRRILLTHSHPDHAGSAGPLARYFDARVFCSEAELPYLHGKRKMFRDYSDSSLYYRFIAEADKWLGEPIYEDSETFSAEPAIARDYEVIDMPGHTPGSVLLVHKKSKSAFWGDALLNSTADSFMPKYRLTLPIERVSSDHYQALLSLSSIGEVDFDNAFFGHGPPIIGRAKEKIYSYLHKKGLVR